MSDFVRDGEMDRIVRELNRSGGEGNDPPIPAPSLPALAPPRRAVVREGEPLEVLLRRMVALGASDLLLTAAETGHLILSTLHTNDAAQSVHRIVDFFPPVQQNQVRQQLALSLSAIVCLVGFPDLYNGVYSFAWELQARFVDPEAGMKVEACATGDVAAAEILRFPLSAQVRPLFRQHSE